MNARHYKKEIVFRALLSNAGAERLELAKV